MGTAGLLGLRVNGRTWDELARDPRLKVSSYLAACLPRRLPQGYEHKTIEPKTAAMLVENYFYCQICGELFRRPKTIKPCLHKCCSDCISEYIRKYRKECPFCRDEVLSKRTLREDPRFVSVLEAFIKDEQEFTRAQDTEQQALVAQSIQNFQAMEQIRRTKELAGPGASPHRHEDAHAHSPARHAQQLQDHARRLQRTFAAFDQPQQQQPGTRESKREAKAEAHRTRAAK